MNVFTYAIAALGLTPESQGEAAWLRALFLVADGSGANTHENPYREAISRLQEQGVDGAVLLRVEQLLNTAMLRNDK